MSGSERQENGAGKWNPQEQTFWNYQIRKPTELLKEIKMEVRKHDRETIVLIV